MSVVDLSTGRTVASITIAGHPAGIAMSRDGARAYVTSPDGHMLSMLDAASRTVLRQVTLPGGPLLNACLLSGGLNLADATNRAVITSEEVNEPQWAVNIINAMLAIGAPVATPNWQLYGLSAAPALADIQAILLSKSFGQVAATIQSQIQSSVITTVAGIESAIAPLLATAQANLGG